MSVETIAGKLYDKTGREIMIGDVLKVYHYTAAVRRERVYLYKQVVGIRKWPLGSVGYYISHLEGKDDTGYYLMLDNKQLLDYEIVQSVDACFKDRPRTLLQRNSNNGN